VVEAETLALGAPGAPGAAVPSSSVLELARFSRLVKLRAFAPFTSAENALSNINDISEGVMSADLRTFLEANLPAVGSKVRARARAAAAGAPAADCRSAAPPPTHHLPLSLLSRAGQEAQLPRGRARPKDR